MLRPLTPDSQMAVAAAASMMLLLLVTERSEMVESVALGEGGLVFPCSCATFGELLRLLEVHEGEIRQDDADDVLVDVLTPTQVPGTAELMLGEELTDDEVDNCTLGCSSNNISLRFLLIMFIFSHDLEESSLKEERSG